MCSRAFTTVIIMVNAAVASGGKPGRRHIKDERSSLACGVGVNDCPRWMALQVICRGPLWRVEHWRRCLCTTSFVFAILLGVVEYCVRLF
uniref:Putative secreted protein n=1 Tax=Rhipicephalus microplus TaxID=6941 RepID=A0A6M2DBG7_RHIMP